MNWIKRFFFNRAKVQKMMYAGVQITTVLTYKVLRGRIYPLHMESTPTTAIPTGAKLDYVIVEEFANVNDN